MAYIVDYAVTIYTAVTANMVCNMPAHATGDLLVACVNKDTNTAFTTPSGWYAAIAANHTNGASGGIYTKRAASAAETVTFALTSETCMAVVISVRGQYWDGSTTDGSDALNQKVETGSDDSALPFTGATVTTTTHDNQLLIHALSGDAVYGTFCLPGIVQLFAGDTGANSLAVGYTYKKTAGACYVPSFFSGTAADDTRGFAVSIRDDGNLTAVSPYVGTGSAGATLLSVLSNNVSGVNRGALKTASPLDIATVGAKTLTYIAYTTNTADVGYNPFHGVLRFNATSSTTVLYGQELTFTSAEDFTAGAGVLFGLWQFTAPRDYLDVGNAASGGVLVGVADADNDYKFWCIGAQFAKTTKPWDMQPFAIQVNGSSDTSYATSGSIAYATINDVYFAAQGYFGATQLDFSQLWLLNEVQVLGGSSTTKLNFLNIETAVNNGTGSIPLLQRSGSAGTLWTRIKFGGADATHIGCNLNVFQYPKKADEAAYLDFHVDNNHMGVEFYGLSGDTLSFTNCVFTSDSPYYWRFNSSHSSGATISFAGTSVVNATVTLRSTVTLTGTIFINCGTFTQNSAVLTGCSFTNTKVTSATPADAALITGSSFTSGGTGYAIEIGGTAANLTLDGNSFSGYAASDGSTGNEAIYVNIATGSMTISITGGGSTPSIRTAGATVTVQNAVTVKVTVKDVNTGAVIENARVLLEAAAGGPLTAGTDILSDLTNSSGIVQTTAFNYTASQPVTGKVRKSSATPFYKTSPISGTISATGLDVTIFMIPDE